MTDDPAAQRSARDPSPEEESTPGHMARAISAVEGAVESVAAAVGGAARAWTERPGERVRRIRRRGREPLASLYDLHPGARFANPRERGIRTLALDEIAGTAVAGGPQRGGDFLPLRLFRSRDWIARWARIRRAIDNLEILPPIEVVKYDGRFWVLDGHNRVAAALYGGHAGIDAVVTELVPPGGIPSEPPASLAASLVESRALRAAAGGGSPSGAVTLDDEVGLPEPSSRPDGERRPGDRRPEDG